MLLTEISLILQCLKKTVVLASRGNMFRKFSWTYHGVNICEIKK